MTPKHATDWLPELRGTEAKLDRASEHLDALTEATRKALDRRPYATPVERQSDGWYLTTVRVTGSLPPRLSSILGDFLHNIRGALDHAAWQLVKRNVVRGDVPSPTESEEKRIQFPIYDCRSRFLESTTAKFLTGGQIAFLEKVQPYKGGDNAPLRPLSVLAVLSNTDKHRALHRSLATLAGGHDVRLEIVAHGLGPLLDTEFLLKPTDRLETGTPVVRHSFMGPATRTAHVDVQAAFPVYVAFGNRDLRVRLDAFQGLLVFVSALLQDFQGLLAMRV